MVFNKVGVDYAGPIMVKWSRVQASDHESIHVHFRVVHGKGSTPRSSVQVNNTTFIACLCRFIARQGKPTIIWSDHNTNFVGAARELKNLYAHLGKTQMEHAIDTFCADLHLNMLHISVGYGKQW